VALAESIPAMQEPLGQVDNCQFGLFLGYAANRARPLADDVARLRQVTCRGSVALVVRKRLAAHEWLSLEPSPQEVRRYFNRWEE
jgi:hypothetical protein